MYVLRHRKQLYGSLRSSSIQKSRTLKMIEFDLMSQALRECWAYFVFGVILIFDFAWPSEPAATLAVFAQLGYAPPKHCRSILVEATAP